MRWIAQRPPERVQGAAGGPSSCGRLRWRRMPCWYRQPTGSGPGGGALLAVTVQHGRRHAPRHAGRGWRGGRGGSVARSALICSYRVRPCRASSGAGRGPGTGSARLGDTVNAGTLVAIGYGGGSAAGWRGWVAAMRPRGALVPRYRFRIWPRSAWRWGTSQALRDGYPRASPGWRPADRPRPAGRHTRTTPHPPLPGRRPGPRSKEAADDSISGTAPGRPVEALAYPLGCPRTDRSEATCGR